MVEAAVAAVWLAIQTAVIASSFATLEQRADAVLGCLRRVMPFRAGQISLVDMERRQAVLLAATGLADDARAYYESPAACDEFELLGVFRSQRPMRFADFPVKLSEIPGWVRHLGPAGFRGGVFVGLRTPDGRDVGFLGLHTDSVAHPTVADRDLIGALVPVIANAVDPLHSIAMAARMRDATAGILVSGTGEAIALPGLPMHPLLADGAPVRVLVAQLASGRSEVSFLSPPARDSPERGYVRIPGLWCTAHAPCDVVAAVLVSPPRTVHQMTARELQIVGLLIEGWSNRRIAQALFISDRTVATHVEHIIANLGAGNRSLAAIRALTHGEYVPQALLPGA